MVKGTVPLILHRPIYPGIFIESNTRLKSAIPIYRKLGFKELPGYYTTYERGDIQMELGISQYIRTSCHPAGTSMPP